MSALKEMWINLFMKISKRGPENFEQKSIWINGIIWILFFSQFHFKAGIYTLLYFPHIRWFWYLAVFVVYHSILLFRCINIFVIHFFVSVCVCICRCNWVGICCCISFIVVHYQKLYTQISVYHFICCNHWLKSLCLWRE